MHVQYPLTEAKRAQEEMQLTLARLAGEFNVDIITGEQPPTSGG